MTWDARSVSMIGDIQQKALQQGRYVAIDVQAAADHYWCSEHDQFDPATDIPAMAPAFPFMEMHWRMPERGWWQGEWHDVPEQERRTYRVLVTSSKVDESGTWGVVMDQFVSGGYVCTLMFRVAPDGTYAGAWDNSKHFAMSFVAESVKAYTAEDLIAVGATWLQLPCLAMSFMHCKNIVLKERGSAGQGNHSSHKDWCYKRYTLTIYPVSFAGKPSSTDNAVHAHNNRPMHVCRGHFKDYRSGGGLFGKYHGLYWCPPHTRGSDSNGIIDKDYELAK